MKRYHLITLTALVTILFVGASCRDYVTILPTDRIVEEDFWEDRNDLDGVRYAAYQQLGNCLSDFIVWGDIRSDNYLINSEYSSSQSNTTVYGKIKKAQLDSSMTLYDWSKEYTGINYCNKVLNNGQKVLDNDPQFTTTEWNQIHAEMVALRAMYYFYLARAFKDIPYTTEVISTDEEVKCFTCTDQLTVLDTIIKDVRGVAGQARNRFTKTSDTHGLLTNSGIYALLAEMYLFRSAVREGYGQDKETRVRPDLDSVLYYGQLSVDALYAQNQLELTSSYGSGTNKTDDYGSGISNAQLIKNENMKTSYESGAGTQINVSSYNEIFDQSGNSQESIFEIQYSASDSRTNSVVGAMWGRSDATNFTISQDAMKAAEGGSDERMYRDTRMWYCCQNNFSSATEQLSNYYMLKWCNTRFVSNDKKGVKVSISADNYMNWIMYRLTDVMLMMAEAHAALAFNNEANHINACKAILDAIHKRSDVDESTVTTGDKKRDNYLKLVLNERQLELCGEGKRWFDLVRHAERYAGGLSDNDQTADPRNKTIKDGRDGVKKIVDDFISNSVTANVASTMKNRIKNRYGLYSPIYYRELRANEGLMKQNPVWDREKGKNDNIDESGNSGDEGGEEGGEEGGGEGGGETA